MDKRLFAFYGCFIKSMRNHAIDTFLEFGNILFTQAASIVSLYAIFSNVPVLDGWSGYELLLIYGLFVCNKGVSDFFTASLYSIEKHIVDGSFDGILIRPVAPIYQILGEKLKIGELVNVVIGGTVLTISLFNIDGVNMRMALATAVVFAAISTVLIFSIRLVCMSVAFWTLTSFPVAIAVDNVSKFAQYPSSIYGKGINFVLDFVIPFSIIAYFPALIILKEEIGLFFVSFLIAAIMLCLSLLVWKCGIKNYQSSGH